MIKVFDGAMIFIMALLVFGVVLSLGGVTPELLAPSLFLGLLLVMLEAGRLAFFPSPQVKRSPLHLPVLFFAAYTVARYLTSPIEYEGRIEVFQVLLFGAVYFVAANRFRTARHRKVLLLLLAGLAVFESMFGLWQALTRSDMIFHWARPEAYQGRASGSFVCPNHLAGCLEIILGLLVARLVIVKAEAPTIERSILVKLAFAYAALVSVIGIAFSQSRAGWVSTLAGVMVAIFWGKRFKSQALIWGAVSVIIFGSAAAFLTRTESGWRRVTETIANERGELRLADATLGGRVAMWRGTLEMVKENPVWGSGPGSWQWLFQARKDRSLAANPEYTHNDYLNLLSDYGLVGGGIVLWFFGAFFRHTWLLARPGNLPEQRAFAIGAAASVTAILVHSSVDFNLHIPANAILLVLIIGVTTGMDESTGRYPAVAAGWPGRVGAVAAILIAMTTAWFVVPTVKSAHYLDLGEGHKRRFDYDAAAHYFRMAIAADLKAPLPQIRLGETYLVQGSLRLGEDQAESRREHALAAAEAFEHALRLNRYLSAAWMGRGRAYEMAGEDAKVIESYRKAAEVDPVNASIYFRLGCFFRDKGDIASAEKEFTISHELGRSQDNAPGLNIYDFHNPEP